MGESQHRDSDRPRIKVGYRFSWLANVEGDHSLIAPFEFRVHSGSTFVAKCRDEARHALGQCACGVYFTDELDPIMSLFEYCQEAAFSVQVGIPLGEITPDRHGRDMFSGHAYSSDRFDLKHIWLHPDKRQHVRLIAAVYGVPVSIGVPPTVREQRRVLEPLGVHGFRQYPAPLTGDAAVFRRTLYRYRLLTAARDDPRKSADEAAIRTSARAVLGASMKYPSSAYELSILGIALAEVAIDAGLPHLARTTR